VTARESATGRRYFLRRVSYGKAVTGRQYRKYDTRDRLDSRSRAPRSGVVLPLPHSSPFISSVFHAGFTVARSQSRGNWVAPRARYRTCPRDTPGTAPSSIRRLESGDLRAITAKAAGTCNASVHTSRSALGGMHASENSAEAARTKLPFGEKKIPGIPSATPFSLGAKSRSFFRATELFPRWASRLIYRAVNYANAHFLVFHERDSNK